MHIISLLKFLLFILRKAQNLSTLVALRLTTALRRHVLALNRSGVAKSLVRFWLWIVSRDSKSNLPEARPDTSLPPEQHCKVDNVPDYIACASAPDIIELPSNTSSSRHTAGHPYIADQGHQGLSAGANQTKNVIETVTVAEGNGGSINANSSEIPARSAFTLSTTTPSRRNRYDRYVSMYVMRVTVMSVCEPARSLL